MMMMNWIHLLQVLIDKHLPAVLFIGFCSFCIFLCPSPLSIIFVVWWFSTMLQLDSCVCFCSAFPICICFHHSNHYLLIDSIEMVCFWASKKILFFWEFTCMCNEIWSYLSPISLFQLDIFFFKKQNKTPSPISATHMFMGVEPSSEHKPTTSGHTPKEEWFSFPSSQQFSVAPRGGAYAGIWAVLI